jgi:S1-C subfamily serine protease
LRMILWVGAAAGLLALGAGAGLAYASVRGGNPASFPVAIAAAQDQAEPGILIAHVESGSPAATAGITRGDIITKVADRALNNRRDLEEALKDRKPGETVAFTIQHGDETRTPSVTLGDRGGRPFVGIVPCGPDHDRLFFRAAAGPGALIVRVEPEGPAARAGLKEGDLIVSVDGQQVDRVHPLTDEIGRRKPGDSVTLEVGRPGEQNRTVRVELGKSPSDENRAYLGASVGGPPFHRPGGPVAREFREKMDELAKQGLPTGALIARVEPGSPAEAAGLKVGDGITAADGKALDSPRTLGDAVAAKKPGESIRLSVQSAGQANPRDVDVTLGSHPREAGKAFLGVETGRFLIRKPGPGEAGEFHLPLLPFPGEMITRSVVTRTIELPAPPPPPGFGAIVDGDHFELGVEPPLIAAPLDVEAL